MARNTPQRAPRARGGPGSRSSAPRPRQSSSPSRVPARPDVEGWPTWAVAAAARQDDTRLLLRLAGRATTHPLAWALPVDSDPADLRRLQRVVGWAHRSQRPAASAAAQQAALWLTAVESARPDPVLALEALAWCHLLPRLVKVVPADQWLQLWGALCRLADVGTELSLSDAPVTHQLLAGELPLTLAWLFPDARGSRTRSRAARRALSRGVAELLDDDGLVQAEHWDAWTGLAACWTRCVLISRAADTVSLDRPARRQYERSALQLIRALRPDGTLTLSPNVGRGGPSADLIRALAACQPDRAVRALARQVLPGARPRRAPRQPAPSAYSETAEACVMRADWSPNSPQFTCLFDTERLRSELVVGRQLLWSGDVTPQVQIDRQPLELQSAWTELCWFTDQDVDYLELEVDGSHGWRLQRQMLLARKDHVLVVADAVLGPRPARIHYDVRYPLADDTRFEPLEETREGFLCHRRARYTVLPLALPEWRAAVGTGELGGQGSELSLTMEAHASRLYAPLWFDLAASRARERRTWRQLTVGEMLQAVDRDVAVGYRVQFGRAQWLLYRSLAERANRSVLGQNLSAEFVAARFEMEGTLDPWVEVES